MRRTQRLGAEAVQLALTQGRSRRGMYFRVYFRANGLPLARIALIVAKRNAARAVDRSRVRRVIREVFRKEQERWCGMDCVIRLTNDYVAAEPYVDDLVRLLRRAP